MRLLYLHHNPPDTEKANVIQVLQMCRGFRKAGADVTLALPGGGSDPFGENLLYQVKEKIGLAPDFRLHPLPPAGPPVLKHRLTSAMAGARKLFNNDANFDIVFVRSVYFAHAALSAGFPVVFESHTEVLNQRSKLLNWLYKKVLIHHTRQKNLVRFIAISRSLAEIWKRRGVPEKKILALHDGVSVEDFHSCLQTSIARQLTGLPSDRKIAVYTGSLYNDRGIDAILQLAEDLPDALFCVVGGPESQRQYFERQAQKNGLKNIRFTGHIEHHRVREYLYAADVLLMLWSRKTVTIHICSPLKVFEYMAAGRTIVGHGFPTIKEVLEDGETALLCNPDSYEDLLRQTRKALDMPPNHPMGQKARKLALSKYSWEARAQTILNSLNGSM